MRVRHSRFRTHVFGAKILCCRCCLNRAMFRTKYHNQFMKSILALPFGKLLLCIRTKYTNHIGPNWPRNGYFPHCTRFIALLVC
jgi:hypothetical protein